MKKKFMAVIFASLITSFAFVGWGVGASNDYNYVAILGHRAIKFLEDVNFNGFNITNVNGICFGNDCRASWAQAVGIHAVTQLNQGNGIILTPNPITTTGTIAATGFNATYDAKVSLINVTECTTLTCNVSSLKSADKVFITYKGVQSFDIAETRTVMLNRNDIQVDSSILQGSLGSRGGFGLLDYHQVTSETELRYLVNSTAGTLENLKAIIQTYRK